MRRTKPVSSWTFFPPFIYLLNTYYVSDTALDAGDILVNKTDKNLCTYGIYILVEEADSKQIAKM